MMCANITLQRDGILFERAIAFKAQGQIILEDAEGRP